MSSFLLVLRVFNIVGLIQPKLQCDFFTQYITVKAVQNYTIDKKILFSVSFFRLQKHFFMGPSVSVKKTYTDF